MRKITSRFLAVLLSILLLAAMAFPVSAADNSAIDAFSDSIAAFVQTQGETALTDAARVTGIRRLSEEEVEAVSDKLSSQSDVYIVELKDGRYTYYIAVDFRMEDSAYLARLPVLRKTSHKLFERSRKMAERDAARDPVLMDYTHIVGEIGLHYFVFRVTDDLGGASLKGLFGKLYRSSVVADLNIDEDRFPILIRVVGLLIGQ